MPNWSNVAASIPKGVETNHLGKEENMFQFDRKKKSYPTLLKVILFIFSFGIWENRTSGCLPPQPLEPPWSRIRRDLSLYTTGFLIQIKELFQILRFKNREADRCQKPNGKFEIHGWDTK